MEPLASPQDLGVGRPIAAAAAAGPRPGLRLLAYSTYVGLLVAVLVAGVWSHAGRGRKAMYKEGAAVETLQSVHLVAAAVLFGAQALRARRAASPAARWVPVVLFLGACLALLRESDFVWKRAGLDAAYRSMKVALALSVAAVVARHRRALAHEWLARPGPSWPPYALLFAAVGGYAAAQLIPKVLEPLGVSFVYSGVAEEAAELLASATFLFAAIELLARARPAAADDNAPVVAAPAPP